MASEREHRDLLKKAQDGLECIEEFLSSIQKSPRTHTSEELVDLVAAAKVRTETFKGELGQVWDLFKRTAT